VVQQPGLRHADAVGDLGQGRAPVAAFREHLERHVQYRLAAGAAVRPRLPGFHHVLSVGARQVFEIQFAISS
jgi:hypothetical protein